METQTMSTIAERKFHDAAGATWIVQLCVPEWHSGPLSGANVEIRFACLSHHEQWILRRRGGSLPEADVELDALLQQARREGSSF